MALYQVNSGDRILAADTNQFYQILKGVAASGETITLIYNAAASLIFQPSSDPAAGTEALQIKNNAGTVQGSLTYDGKLKAADGTAALPSLRFQSEASGLFLSSAGVIGVAAVGATTNILMRANAISIGANPASAGAIRVGNNQGGLYGRNQLNNADVPLIDVDASNIIQIAPFGQATNFSGNGTFAGNLTVTTSPITVGGASGGKVIAAGTVTAGGLLGSGVQVGTSGPLVYSGSGAPSISAAVKGSLYLRTDGTTTNDRIYVAKDTAGTWASLTSAS